MSRLKQFTRSLLSGYATLAANILYTFASVPLALHYLSKAEFGLWALTMQVGAYVALIDLGMSGSVSRLLIDHKDDPAGGEYGGFIKTGALVGAIQGVAILIAGAVLAFSIGDFLRVPTELRRDFAWLMIAQSAVLCLSFLTRIFAQILVAHQRYDITNHAQTAVFLLSLLGMWIGFAMGLGVYSLLATQVIGAILNSAVNFGGVVRLRLLPAPGRWGQINRQKFKELFSYGGSLFVFLVGQQFVNASQIILLTRFMGLDVAAIWTVATRLYTMMTMLFGRSQEYSGPPLAEMFVRGELTRMRDRLRDLTCLTTNAAVFGGLALALCNDTFVQVWTRGRVQWNPVNDLLLALWLVAGTAMRAHVNLAGATKRFEFLCHVILAEGFLFVGLNILLNDVDGMTRMLLISVLCSISFSLLYTLRRTRRFFSLTWNELAAWHTTTGRILWRMALVGAATWALTNGWQPIPRLIANALICAVGGGLILLRYGLGRELQSDIASKLPPIFRRMVLFVRAI